MAKSAKPQPTFSTQLKVLTKPSLLHNGKFASTAIYQKGGEIYTLLYSPNMMDELREDGYYLVTNIKTLTNNWLATDKAEFLLCPPFRTDEEKVKSFFFPPLVSIQDVLTSIEGRRLSVEGKITEVSEVLVTSSSKRREVTLTDGHSTVKCILWGAHADTSPPESGSNAILQNLQVKQFRGRIQLHSRDQFSMKTEDKIHTVTGVVDGVSFKPGNEFVMIEDHRIQMTRKQLLDLFPDGKPKSISISIQVKNGQAQDIEILHQSKKRKTE